MTGNSIDSTPLTPLPDPPSHSGEEPAPDRLPPPVAPAKQPVPVDITTSSEDDLNLVLAQSVPDPFLDEAVSDPSAGQSARLIQLAADESASAPGAGVPGGSPELAGLPPDIDGGEPTSVLSSLSSSETGFQLPVIFTPSPEAVGPDALSPERVPDAPSAPPQEMEDEGPPGISWPLLLVASYASAVTLALLWILWTGRGLTRPSSVADSSWETGPVDSGKPANRAMTGSSPVPLPARNLTTLGIAARLGDLEVTPLTLSLRDIELVRLDGFTGETREVEDVLVLSLRFRNRSLDRAFSPLQPSFVRDSNSADDDSYIETAAGLRIPMYHLAPESEWSIKDQRFPTLEPDETGETIVVSEPVQMSELTGPLIWHLKLRTGTYQTNVVGVRFSPENVSDGGF